MLPAQDLGWVKAFYVEKVGLQALEPGFLRARDGQVGLAVGDGANQLFVYPARDRRALGVAALTDGSYLQAFTQLRGLFSEDGTPLQFAWIPATTENTASPVLERHGVFT